MLHSFGSLSARVPAPVSRKHHWLSLRVRRPLSPVLAASSSFDPRNDVEVEDFFSRPSPADLWARQASPASSLSRQLDAMQRQVDREFEGTWARAERLAQRVQQAAQQGEARVEQGDGWQSYSREHSWEDRSEGVWRREYYSERVTVVGPRPTLAPPQQHAHASLLPSFGLLLVAFLAGVWAAATAAFCRNFHLTSYDQGKRWQLLLLWPLLMMTSPAFRQQFWAAVRGWRASATEGGADGEGDKSSGRAAAAQ